MKKIFKVEELDCAHCAQKIEDAVKKLDGVISANMNFMAQKFTLEANDDIFDDVLKSVLKLAKKIEPDCVIKV